jgi:hypothetical protein
MVKRPDARNLALTAAGGPSSESAIAPLGRITKRVERALPAKVKAILQSGEAETNPTLTLMAALSASA